MFEGCEAGAVTIIEAWFHDCVYSIKDGTGFVLGLTSIALWITAQLPQFLDNIRNQSADALSVWFLAQWFLGDTLNLLGCLMSGEQLATTTALAMYFVLSDVIMLTQYVYFGALQRRKRILEQRTSFRRASKRQSLSHVSSPLPGHHHHHHHHRASAPVIPAQDGTVHQNLHRHASQHQHHMHSPVLPADDLLVIQPCEQQGAQPRILPATSSRLVASAIAAGSVLTILSLATIYSQVPDGGVQGMGFQPQPHLAAPGYNTWHNSDDHVTHLVGKRHPGIHDEDDLPWWQDVDELMRVMGAFCGYCSMVLYLSSRVSQIYRNWSRRSAEGLSVIMFLFTISANLCTGSSILLRLQDVIAFKAQLPWIVGAFGTVGLDAFIFYQANSYNKKDRADLAAAQLAAADMEASAGAGGTDAAPAAGTANPLLQPLIPE